jgi:ubiquinone/menaquinone biosynthesis C-methylase UbiE
VADAAEMPYADDSFDLVTAFLTLHEMPTATRTAVMAEMVGCCGRHTEVTPSVNGRWRK